MPHVSVHRVSTTSSSCLLSSLRTSLIVVILREFYAHAGAVRPARISELALAILPKTKHALSRVNNLLKGFGDPLQGIVVYITNALYRSYDVFMNAET